jgi:hypothetical protein
MTASLRDVPKSLFKYFGPERSDVLLTRLLKFTPLGEFNDPFEGRPHIQGFATEATTRELFEQHLPKEMALGYDKLPPDARARMTREQYLAIAMPLMREKFPELFQGLQRLAEGFIREIPTKLDQNMGALCMSEVPDSLLMWAHYGASHSGFALELNAHHAYFHRQLTEKDELRHIRRVLYRDSRPSGTLTDLDGSDVFLVKSSHWSYEREWRMFMPLVDADQVVEASSNKIHLYRLPPSAISGVVLGARASEQTTEAVRQAVGGNPELAHVRIRSCAADEAEFVLRISPAT